MHSELKANLEKALVAQTSNKSLAGALVAAVEEDIKKPKEIKKQSKLQLAVQKEKGRRFKSGLYISEDGEE